MHHPIDVAVAQKRFIELGVWIRPFGRLLYIMPPYVISKNELSCLIRAMKDYAETQSSIKA